MKLQEGVFYSPVQDKIITIHKVTPQFEDHVARLYIVVAEVSGFFITSGYQVLESFKDFHYIGKY